MTANPWHWHWIIDERTLTTQEKLVGPGYCAASERRGKSLSGTPADRRSRRDQTARLAL